MSEWIRVEQPLRWGALVYETVYAKGEQTRVIHVDRILVDRYGPEWREREELRLLSDPRAKPDRYIGGVVPKGPEMASEDKLGPDFFDND